MQSSKLTNMAEKNPCEIYQKECPELQVPGTATISRMKAGEQVFSTGERQNAEVSLGEGAKKSQILCSFSPLHATTGRINAVDIIFHDITNETKISEELYQCRTQVSSLRGQKSAGPDKPE